MNNETVEQLVKLTLQGNTDALAELALRAEQADHKYLTGMLNDRGFQRELEKEESRVQRGQSVGGIVMNIDLAGFKRINDTHGYDEGGNLALKEFSNHMKRFGFRNTDIIANPGGDEFFAVMTNAQLVAPDDKYDPQNPKQSFLTAASPKHSAWLRAENFIRSSRMLGFSGIDKNGEAYTDTMSARITVSEYGDPTKGQRSLSDAIKQSDKQTETLKRLTKNYIIGGR